MPVVTHAMDFQTFLAGGVISLVLTGMMWLTIYARNLRGLVRDEKMGKWARFLLIC